MENDMNWYYKDGDSKVGPVSDEQIRQLASQGKITPETKVWNELISKWLPYGEIIGSNSTPPPKTTQPGLSAPEKADESAGDSYADLDAGNTVHKSDTFDETQSTREREATAICADCGSETAWSRTHSTMPAWEMLNIEKNLLIVFRQAHRRAATNLNLQVQEASTFASGSSIYSYR